MRTISQTLIALTDGAGPKRDSEYLAGGVQLGESSWNEHAGVGFNPDIPFNIFKHQTMYVCDVRPDVRSFGRPKEMCPSDLRGGRDHRYRGSLRMGQTTAAWKSRETGNMWQQRISTKQLNQPGVTKGWCLVPK